MKIIFITFLLWTHYSFAQSSGDTTFNTKVAMNLRVSGVKCTGVESSGRSSLLCKENQWLVTIDRNFCNGTICTEREFLPFIADFILKEVPAPEDIEYFQMKAVEKISMRDKLTLIKYWVRFARYLDPLVLERPKTNLLLK